MSMSGLYCREMREILEKLEREISYFEYANVEEVNALRQLYKDLNQFALKQIFNLNSTLHKLD